MIRVIKVKGKTGKFQTPSFLYTDNETLTLKFDIAEHRVGKYVAIVKCGAQEKKVYLNKDMTVEITPTFIKDGNFEPLLIFLEYRTKNGQVVISNDPSTDGFFIEPLRIEQTKTNTTFIAWATDLEARMAKLENAEKTILEKLEQFENEGVPLLAETEIE